MTKEELQRKPGEAEVRAGKKLVTVHGDHLN